MTDTNICDRCGDEYKSYTFAARDTFSDVVEANRSEYDNLCRPCRLYLHPRQAVPGGGKIEPKEEVEQ